MSVPVPITISIGAPPAGWKAQSPNQFADLAYLVASLLSGTMNANFLTGQVGGSAPSSNIGPWANGTEWWFWDASITPAQYQPSEQGSPVGTILMWGTRDPNKAPARWLVCKGQPLPISVYPRLWNAVGATWGYDGTNFWLPPTAVMFLNAAGYSPDSHVNYDATDSPDRQVNITGGSQTAMLNGTELPAGQIQIPNVKATMNTGSTNQPNILSPGSSKYSYPVVDEYSNPIGANQKAVSTMPPFVVVHYIIKYL